MDCLELLIQHGGDVDIADEQGYTPLMIAAERGHERAVGMLLVSSQNFCGELLICYNAYVVFNKIKHQLIIFENLI